MNMGTIGTLTALILLVVLVYKGWGVIQTSFLAALIVILTNGPAMGNFFDAFQNYFLGIPVPLPGGGYSQTSGLTGFVAANMFVIVTGSLFGAVMAESGAAKSIAIGLGKRFGAKNAILITMVATAILIAGGISAFVCMYAVFPLAVVLFHQADIPRKYLLGSYWCAVFVCVGLPGVPTVHNIVPSEYLGTDVMAGPVVGLICTAFAFTADYLFLTISCKRAKARGEHFVVNPETDGVQIQADGGGENMPAFLPSLLAPAMAVFLCILSNYTLVRAGICSTNNAVSFVLIVVTLYCLVAFGRFLPKKMETVTNGIQSGLVPVFLVAFVVAFGNVVTHTELYTNIVDFALNLDMSPYFSAVLSVNILAGITASGLGGLQIFMASCAQHFVELGVNPGLLHRVAAMSAAGLDSLPNNGSIVTSLKIMGSDFKESYGVIFVVTVVITIGASSLGAAVATILTIL